MIHALTTILPRTRKLSLGNVSRTRNDLELRLPSNLPGHGAKAIGFDDRSDHVRLFSLFIEAHSSERFSVPYRHPAYMPLRYPLIFPMGEPSWHSAIPNAGAGNITLYFSWKRQDRYLIRLGTKLHRLGQTSDPQLRDTDTNELIQRYGTSAQDRYIHL